MARGERTGIVWALAFAVVATLAGLVALGHPIEVDLVARWAPGVLIVLGAALAGRGSRRGRRRP